MITWLLIWLLGILLRLMWGLLLGISRLRWGLRISWIICRLSCRRSMSGWPCLWVLSVLTLRWITWCLAVLTWWCSVCWLALLVGIVRIDLEVDNLVPDRIDLVVLRMLVG